MTGAAVLDELMANAWPAEVSEPLRGWRLRWSQGLSRRANSVLPSTAEAAEIPELVDRCERFYRSRRADPMFQVSSASAPAGLRRCLDGRGYVATARTLVAQAPTANVISALEERQGIEVAVSDAPSEEWFDLYWSVSRPGASADHAELCRRVLLSPALETVFVTAHVGGRAAGVGQAVFEAGFAGVQCMATWGAQRRHGVGSAVLGELADQARQRQVAAMYLAVMADNAPARALYDAAGFRTTHEYRYLVSSD